MTLLLLLMTLNAASPDPAAPGPGPTGSATAAPASGPLVLRLRFAVPPPAPGDRLTLGEIATCVADPQGLWPLVEPLILPETPGGHIGWADVRHRLRGLGLDPRGVRLVGPALCVLSPGAEPAPGTPHPARKDVAP